MEEKLNHKLINLYQVFYLAFACLAFLAVLSSSYLTQLFPIGRWLSIWQQFLVAFSIIIIVKKSFKISIWIKLMIIFIIILLSTIASGEGRFLIITLFCLSVSNNDIEKVIKAMGYGILTSIVLVVMLALLGVIPNITVFETGRLRQTLGFSIPVLLSGFFLNIGYVYLFLNRKKMVLKKCFILIIPAAIIYWFTRGRASFYSLLFVTLFTYIINKLPKGMSLKITLILCRMAKSIYIISFLLSIYIASNYVYSYFLQSLDHITTGRFGWFSLYWNIYTPTLFGQELVRVGSHESSITNAQMMILDNAYLTLLLEYGILVTIIVTLLIFSLLKHLMKKHDPVSIVIWLTIFVTFLFSNNGMFFWRNPLLFQFAYLVGREKSENKILI